MSITLKQHLVYRSAERLRIQSLSVEPQTSSTVSISRGAENTEFECRVPNSIHYTDRGWAGIREFE